MRSIGVEDFLLQSAQRGRGRTLIIVDFATVCVHGKHFEDPVKITRTIASSGPDIVSIRPETPEKSVTPVECGFGYNVRIGKTMVLDIEGGNRSRPCGWISRRRYVYIMYGGDSAGLRSVSGSSPEKSLFLGFEGIPDTVDGGYIIDGNDIQQNIRRLYSTV